MAEIENPEVMYLNAKLYVRPEHQKEFIALSPLYAEVIFENYGYQLVHASYPTTGEVDVFNHIWRIPKDVPLAGVMLATAKEAEREAEREARIASVEEAAGEVLSTLSKESGPAKGTEKWAALRSRLQSHPITTSGPQGAPALSRQSVTRLLRELEVLESKAREAGYAWVERLGRAHQEFQKVGAALTKSKEALASPGTSASKAARQSAAARSAAADVLANLGNELALAALGTLSDKPALAGAFARAALEAAAQARKNRAIPGIADPFRRIQSLIERTEQNLMTALPYDPTYFGYQSQTILVDTEGEIWVLEHDDLREKHQSLAQMSPTAVGSAEQEIQALLEQGATVGALREKNGCSLLFNLAGLRPKSVFQHRAAAVVADAASPQFKLPATNHRADLPGAVHAVYLSTTWGETYRLEKKDIETLAQPIPGEAQDTTKRLIQKLLDARVPLAAVPEVRDQDVGFGYYCYVINLSSFVNGAGGLGSQGSSGAE